MKETVKEYAAFGLQGNRLTVKSNGSARCIGNFFMEMGDGIKYPEEGRDEYASTVESPRGQPWLGPGLLQMVNDE